MTKKSSVRWLAATILLFPGLHAGAQETVQSVPTPSVVILGQKNVSDWFRAESQHFIVYSDTTEKNVAILLDNLERLDYLLRIYTRDYIKTAEPEPKLTLYFNDRVNGFNVIAADRPADAIGLYNSCTAGVQGLGVQLGRIAELSNEQLVKHPLDDSLSYIFEAYARHFLYRHTDIRMPVSFIEGFAQYFSSVRFSSKRMVLGRMPTNVGSYLKFLDDGHRYSLTYLDILEPDGRENKNYAGPAGAQLEFEAKSWLLTHYMMSSEDRRTRMRNYLKLVHRDTAPAQAFEEAFGMKVKDLSNAMWRYHLNSIQVLEVDLPSLPIANVGFSSLSQSAGEFLIGEAKLKSCPNQREGEALLHALAAEAAKFPGSDAAHLALSRAQVDWGKAQDALPYLDKAIEQGKGGFDAVYLSGMANLRLAEQSDGAARRSYLDASRNRLLRARGMNPKSPEAALAFLRSEVLAGAPDAAALDGVISAWQDNREIPALARSAALSLAYQGDGVKAESILRSMIRNTRSPKAAAWATGWQNSLDAGLSQSAILAEMRNEPASNTEFNSAFKEWTIDNESVMQRVAYNAGLENAQGVIDQQMQDPDPAKALYGAPIGK